jgi:hypothetical protein
MKKKIADKKHTFTKKKHIRTIIATLTILAILGILLLVSFNSQNEIKYYLNSFNERWDELELEYLDLASLDSPQIPLITGEQMASKNEFNFLPSRFENLKQIKRISDDEQLLSDLGKEYRKIGNIGDTSKEFSIEEEQKKLDKMYNYFDSLSTEGKKQFKPVKESLDEVKKSLQIISDYSKHYYIPIDRDDLIPTAYKFPLDTDIAKQYYNRISDELGYSYSNYVPNADTDEEDSYTDIRETDWNNGPYGILSWGESLYRYYLDLEGSPETASAITDSLNLGGLTTDIIKGQHTKKEMEKQDPNDMSEAELSTNLIYSLASGGYYERATQDDDKATTSVITPSLWVLQKNGKILLKATFNGLKTALDEKTAAAIYSMTDTKTEESFDITITNNYDDGSYHVTGQTPVGEINHDYKPLSSKNTKKTNSSTSEELLPSANVSKETMDNTTIESYCTVFGGRFVTNTDTYYTSSSFSKFPNSWRIERTNGSTLISAEFLGIANTTADGTVQFNMKDKETEKEFLLNVTPNSDWDGYEIQSDTPIGKIHDTFVAVDSNKNTRRNNGSNNSTSENEENMQEADSSFDDFVQGGYTGEDATNPFD